MSEALKPLSKQGRENWDRIFGKKVSDYFEKDGAPKKCPKCGSTTIHEKVLGMVDVFQGMGPTCEAEYYCECGELVGFWAYGSWHPDAMRNFLSE